MRIDALFAAAIVLALPAGAAGAATRPAGPAASVAASTATAPSDPAQERAALAVARDRAARASAAVDDLKRELAPAHLTDPMPEVDRAFGLSSLRSDYADAQRRAAGYRATLGDQHPTLLATEQLMEGLRGQLLDGTRRALAAAERDAADARADVAAIERRLAAAARPSPSDPRAADARADVTGSLAAPARPAARAPSPLSLPPEAPTAAAPARPAQAVPDAEPAAPARHMLRSLALAAAAAGAAALLAAWAALRLLRPRRPRSFPAPRRVEPAMAPPPALPPVPPPVPPTTTIDAEAPAGVPVLGRFRPSNSPAAPGDAMAGLHATLRDAFGDDAARMTVLVAPAAGLSLADADAAAFALASAAAAAGRRPLLMEARARGRLRGALAPAGAAAVAIEAGGAVRTLYRVGPDGAVALLPSDPGEAEAAAEALAGPAGVAPQRGFDAFDTVVLVGDDAASLARSADLSVLAAPAGTPPAALDAAAGPLRALGRPCGAVLVEAGVAVPPQRPAPRPIPRRRSGAEPAPAVRLGLRGSFDPARRAG